jgi:hypothetical protein
MAMTLGRADLTSQHCGLFWNLTKYREFAAV